MSGPLLSTHFSDSDQDVCTDTTVLGRYFILLAAHTGKLRVIYRRNNFIVFVKLW